MSRRSSTSQSNTILNYFQSPSSKSKKIKLTPEESQSTKEQDISESDVKKIENESEVEEEDYEMICTSRKRKGKRLIDSDSSSNEENQQNITNGTSKKFKSTNEHDDFGDKKTKLDISKFKANYSSNNKKDKNDNNKDIKVIKDDNKPVGLSNEKDSLTDTNQNWLHNNLDFLKPKNIRDKNKKPPNHPDYDPHTLYVPKDFLDKQTPAMRQWWLLKSDHMDSVIFFKVGKFYELYHMDAVVGVNHLGFSYMKGEFAHSGFPESAFHKMATALMAKGFKVARTEQTETPEMMAERCKKQTKTTKYDKVVNREICAITSKATCVYNAQLPEAMNSLSYYLYAIVEKEISSSPFYFGVCFIDTSLGVFNLAEFTDDKHCSKLLAIFAEYPPGLILTERRKTSKKLKNLLNTYFKDIRKDELTSDTQFYDAERAIEKLLNGAYYRDKNNVVTVPDFLKNIIDGFSPKPQYASMIKSLGACLWYLEDSKLDIQVVSMGKFQMYVPLNIDDDNTQRRSFMILDASTLSNLSLLGGPGSLQKTIDFCQSPFGKRLLVQWICRPLCDIDQIIERQEAVKELKENSYFQKELQVLLKKMPDLERQVAKIHSYGNKQFAKNHPDSRAIFYEAAIHSKRRISDLLKTLRAFEVSLEIPKIFNNCQSNLLKKLTQFEPNGLFINIEKSLDYFKGAFDQKAAEESGKIIPKLGVDEDYDNSVRTINDIKKKLDDYLKEQELFFGCKLSYFGSDKKRFQLDVPEKYSKKATSEYQLEGSKKGSKASKRYSTSFTKEMLADMIKAESEKEKIIQDLNRAIFEKFSERQTEWEQIIKYLSILDVLSSLAEFARTYPQDICLPIIDDFSNEPKIIIENGRHPCIINVDNFVPNDTKMGIENHPAILLITGPNMGGKSTLMRQVALLTILAQMGCYVPASYIKMNLIDRIFTRLGAHDNIVEGQSTFLVELAEASIILQHATKNSLVLLDELGRGTSTHDGNAIATAYLKKLINIECRSLFSTHYHSLVDHFINNSNIQLGHMACMVENDDDPTEESVTFLYKLAMGNCPKSYGFNVARLAGLKHSIVIKGREIAKQLEEQSNNRKLIAKIFTSDITTVGDLLQSLFI